jgi:hypothetical protein
MNTKNTFTYRSFLLEDAKEWLPVPRTFQNSSQEADKGIPLVTSEKRKSSRGESDMQHCEDVDNEEGCAAAVV